MKVKRSLREKHIQLLPNRAEIEGFLHTSTEIVETLKTGGVFSMKCFK